MTLKPVKFHSTTLTLLGAGWPVNLILPLFVADCEVGRSVCFEPLGSVGFSELFC